MQRRAVITTCSVWLGRWPTRIRRRKRSDQRSWTPGLPKMVTRILSDRRAGVAKEAPFNGGALALLSGRSITPLQARITGFVHGQQASSGSTHS